ncbi:ABC transporter ATP-binding protein [Microlunatus sp. GCM10028923]|uniref:ABC transporter ATP-binding protein n=1 Tax=Microlunatus sp. GCM10028923 TaxID=3273400 RepID=UPI0036236F58
MTEPLLEVRGLTTEFRLRSGTRRVVDGIDLTIRPGRTLCLVGESGSGKSQTALSIMGLVDRPGYLADGSSVRYDGRELTGLSEHQLQQVRGNEISMIFQEPMSSLNPSHRVGAQIAEAVLLHRKGSKAAAMERAIEMLTLVGVPDPARRAQSFPHQLSGGLRQRVMIAMALSCDPRLLIADEPTTALDVTIQAQILDLMRELKERLGMAILMITHDLGVVAELADDVAVMYAGRIVEYGSVTDTFERPKHPYTKALLESIPVIGMRSDQRLTVIRGTVPNPRDWPVGCRFADRCDAVFEPCRTEYPELRPAGDQQVACWLHDPRYAEREAAAR